MDVSEYCRDIETYLCRKNDGHLIRIVGPSFDLVSRWAEQGVPLKVACAGIDRYFDRYYAKGPRRRPVRIDFCEADVLDVFDEWRRATGLTQSSVTRRKSSVESRQSSVDESSVDESSVDESSVDESSVDESSVASPAEAPIAGRQSLPAHLERVVTRLTTARASGVLPAAFDALIDRAAAELDAARAKPGGVRGDARRALIARLRTLDDALLRQARALLDDGTLVDLAREADLELAPFRSALDAAQLTKAREATIDRLVRDRFRLPTIEF